MIDRAEVERRIVFVQRYAHKLEEMARLSTERFVADEHWPASAERYLQVACEACVEIGLLVISGLNLRRPVEYEEMAEILTSAGFVAHEYGGLIERIIKVRDLLIHGYSSIEPHALHQQLTPRVQDLQFFASQAGSFLRRTA
jgi:uncharacterized protein YutE (UPF0331/DUF86 family)